MFDSRNKILTMAEARRLAAVLRGEGRRVRAVIAYFDPLLPAQIERLRDLAGEESLFVVLAPVEDALLDARARAELAAAMSFVRAVLVCDGDPEQAAAALQADEILHELTREAGQRAEWMRRVRERARQS